MNALYVLTFTLQTQGFFPFFQRLVLGVKRMIFLQAFLFTWLVTSSLSRSKVFVFVMSGHDVYVCVWWCWKESSNDGIRWKRGAHPRSRERINVRVLDVPLHPPPPNCGAAHYCFTHTNDLIKILFSFPWHPITHIWMMSIVTLSKGMNDLFMYIIFWAWEQIGLCEIIPPPIPEE